jgi:DNA processing protein
VQWIVGDLAVAEWVQNLGAKAVSAKIMERALGEPAASGCINIDVVERLAKHAAMRFIVPGDDEWPSELDDLRHAESIQRRGDEPLVDGYPLGFAQASEGLPLKFVRAV